MLQRQTDRQPDGKPDWYLERTALNKTHNQIANRRQPAIVLRVIPWMEKSIQRLRFRESAISPSSVGWFEFTVRINAIPRFRFGLWLFSLWLIIQRVFSNLCSYGEYYGSSLHVPFCEGENLKKGMSCTCTTEHSLVACESQNGILCDNNGRERTTFKGSSDFFFIRCLRTKALSEYSFHFIN